MATMQHKIFCVCDFIKTDSATAFCDFIKTDSATAMQRAFLLSFAGGGHIEHL
jgi:hypothetical protein